MRRILLSVLMAGVASSALAADLPTTKGPPPAPYFQPPPAFNWTGFYIGVNGGWGFTDTHNDSFGNNINGGLVGGTVGYNYQMGQFVIGYEGDVDWSDIRGSDFAFTFPGGFRKRQADFGLYGDRARSPGLRVGSDLVLRDGRLRRHRHERLVHHDASTTATPAPSVRRLSGIMAA